MNSLAENNKNRGIDEMKIVVVYYVFIDVIPDLRANKKVNFIDLNDEVVLVMPLLMHTVSQ